LQLPSLVFQLWSALLFTGFLAVGLIIGEANVQTPVSKQTHHLNFPPKLGSNSIFKPETSGASVHLMYTGHKLHAVNMFQSSTTDLWKVVDVLVGVLLVGVV